jgi:hypothetical protein
MIINVEDVFYDKPRFSSVIYFALAFLLICTIAYRKGAGDEASAISLFVMIVSLIFTFGYPLRVYFHFVVRRKKAVMLYKQHLRALTECEIRELRRNKKLSRFSTPFVDEVGKERFG